MGFATLVEALNGAAGTVPVRVKAEFTPGSPGNRCTVNGSGLGGAIGSGSCQAGSVGSVRVTCICVLPLTATALLNVF